MFRHNSETLGYVWKLAHNIPPENVENSNLPKICNELNSWVKSESVMATRRLSLRASSNLIAGTAKLYKKSLDMLFDDVIKMNKDMIYRRKRERLDSSSSESSDATESIDEVPEEMRQPAPLKFADSSISPAKQRRTDPIVKVTPRITMSRSSNDNQLSKVTNSNEETNNDHCSVDDNLDTEHVGTTAKRCNDVNQKNGVEDPFSEEKKESQHKDEGVQRSPILTSRHRENRGRIRQNKGTNISSPIDRDGFDRNLPFGYILVHESYNSRMPSKIIFTSLNSNVNNLI